MVGQYEEPIGGDSSGRRQLKRAVCYAVRLAEFDPLSFDRFDNQFEPSSSRTAPHTLLRMALPSDMYGQWHVIKKLFAKSRATLLPWANVDSIPSVA